MTQAAAGLGDIDVVDLPVGDLGPCGNLDTGTACRGVELGGILAHCTCVNLSETATMLELKQMVTDATGLSTVAASVWTAADQAALLAWADEDSGLFLPDVRRWWRSGYVSADDLLQRTSDGGVYPTGAGILALADRAGCLQDGPSGLEMGPGCTRFPAIAAALGRFYSIVTPSAEDGIAVYPPPFGEAVGPVDPLIPGGDPTEVLVLVRLPEGRRGGVEWLGWSLAGAAVAAAAWALTRRTRHA